MLAVHGLNVSYGRTQVIFDVGFEMGSETLLCVMGRNGVGKTTLLNAIMGLHQPSSGRVLFEGENIAGWSTHRRVAAGLGYVPQGHATFPHLTVRENLAVVVESASGRSAGTLDDVLDLFPALTALMSRRAGVLSGGQQQQLAIARALLARPRLLVLDEPTEGIQPSIILEIEDAISQLHRSRGLSILLVEQYVEFALRLAERYLVLDSGRVVRKGTIGDLDEADLRQLVAF